MVTESRNPLRLVDFKRDYWKTDRYVPKYSVRSKESGN